MRRRIRIPKNMARLLLCAILSDTLDLQSVTATNADRLAVAILSQLGEVIWDLSTLNSSTTNFQNLKSEI